MDKVLRIFTAGTGRVKIGDIVDGSKYRNLGFLRRKGYLQPVGDDVPPTPVEVPVETVKEMVIEPPATEVDDPEVIVTEKLLGGWTAYRRGNPDFSGTGATEDDAIEALKIAEAPDPTNENTDIIDQLANETVKEPAAAAPASKSKSKTAPKKEAK